MKAKFYLHFGFLLICLITLYQPLQATHIRAGEITARRLSATSLTYEFTLIVYTFDGSTVDDPTATIFFGDGGSATVARVERSSVGNSTSKNVYKAFYTYPAAGTYRITYTQQNRNGGVLNMTQSIDTPFSIESVLVIDPFLGINSTPVLLYPPVDLACPGQRYVHNPAAFDIDGDSLSYRLTTPKRSPNEQVVGYQNPNNVAPFGSSETGGAPVFRIDPITGDLIWDAPRNIGEYNVAFIVEEWRNGVRIGYVVRDMQIIVTDCRNRRPVVNVPNEICVEAGTLISQSITATDPDNNLLTLSAVGGMLPKSAPDPYTPPYTNKASFNTILQPQLSPASGIFTWQTACEHIRDEPYQVIFKAEDSPPPPQTRRLSDLKSWRIKVVGARPTGLTAAASGRNMVLNWNTYTCTNAVEIIIWRREGCYPWTPMNCEVGMPAYTGYVQVGKVSANATTFTDTNNGKGLKKGIKYSYRITVRFALPAGGDSYASAEACEDLALDAPIITKVSVTQTNTATGKMRVEWIKPPELNTALFPPPYRYELYRAEGLRGNTFALINTQNDATGAQNTFSFDDNNLNTTDKAYNYRIAFYYGAAVTYKDTSDAASSVRLTAQAAPSSVKLTWDYEVPWSNANQKHRVYRNINGTFTLIGEIAVGGSGKPEFFDRGTFNNQRLVSGQIYCYYVETVGGFYNPAINTDPILNNSQEACAIPFDTTAPCPPTLVIDSLDCVNYNPFTKQNNLSWKKAVDVKCDDDIQFYTLYYSPSEDGNYTKLIQTTSFSFIHDNLQSLAGCYYVTATDFAGNESKRSNLACKDNCIKYVLPNVLTPNGDGKNDLFQPFPDYRFVEAVKFEVFNRWGAKVFESNDILINWDGKSNTGEVVAGTYYYSAEVRFTTLRPSESVKTIQGWIQVIK